jgi:DNA polymerase-3 subunit beta
MKLTIERAALLKTLAHVQSAVERRNTIPILANVLIDAADGQLSLTATDMDLTIVDTVPAEVGEPGATTAPVHTLYDIVRKLPEGAQIEISSAGDGGQIKVEAGRSVFTLATLPREDFPATGDADLPHTFTLQPGELRNLVDRTSFAISTEETRYYLNGIYLHAAKTGDIDVLRAVATDGHRLARFEMPLPEGAADMPGVIVPRKTVAELRKLLEEAEEPVSVSLSDTRIRFALGAALLTSKLIDGTFPDYERVIPVGNDKIVQVRCKSFREAVDRVSTISSEKSRAVKMIISNGAITLSASSADNDTATEEVEVDYGGPDMEIGFNSRYLLDIARQIEGENAEFCLADSASPTVVSDVSDSSALYVLMPMRV